MALGVWQNLIRDTLGRTQQGAQVTVLDSALGTPRDLFADRAGAVAIDNPFSVDADGMARFYTAIGRVDIQIVAGGRTRSLENVVIIDDFPAA